MSVVVPVVESVVRQLGEEGVVGFVDTGQPLLQLDLQSNKQR